MPGWMSQMSAFTVFLTIAGVGFVFVLISLIFGEISDHLEGIGFDHDFEHGGPGILSTRVIAVFVVAFGGFGAIATHYGLTPLPASGVGASGGLVFGSIIYAFARFLWSQQATTEISQNDYVGESARVVVGIPRDGVGQVRCRIGESLIDKIARSRDGAAIPENAMVRIEEILGETVIVVRSDAQAASQQQ